MMTSHHPISRTVVIVIIIIIVVSWNLIGFVQTVLHKWNPFYRKTYIIQTMAEVCHRKPIYAHLILVFP